MLTARRSFNCRWSSVLRSSFTCTFLLPPFFPPCKRRRDNDDGKIPTRRRQMCTVATRREFTIGSLNRKRMERNSTQSCSFTTTRIPREEKHFKFTDRNWISNLLAEFPPVPPEPSESASGPSPLLHSPVDPFEPRFPIHGDLISDERFPALHGFAVPPKPPHANPRYMTAWIDTLLTGLFLPPRFRTTSESDTPEDVEKLLFFLERAWGHKHDLITELVVQGKWRHAVWIVRALLEPAFEYPPGVTQSVFEGTKYTALGNIRESLRDNDGAIPSPAIAGRSGLWAVTDQRVKYDIERRRRGFGIVLGSLCGMVLRAGEEVEGKNRMGDHYTDLLPTARQILAYCHTADFMPEALYSLDRYPRLHILRPRILASLADAAWCVGEATVAEEAANLGIAGEYRGMEVPRARFTLDVWGSGTSDIPARPDDQPIAYSEREVWLELILTAVIEAGYGNVGVSIVQYMAYLSERHNTWSFVDYLALYPNEYTSEAVIRPSAPFETSSIAVRFGLPGHSLSPPPVTTHPLTLPDWILPAIADAVVDSTDEGRGLEAMFRTILSYARVHPMRRETLLRLLRHPALTWSKNAEVMEVGAGLLWEFGNRVTASEMYYSSLILHISTDNVVGAMRVWQNGVLKSRPLCKIPHSITGQYLKLLVKHRKLGYAWDLLRFHSDANPPNPMIARTSYRLPTLSPHLLGLAVHTQNHKLYTDVVTAVAQGRREGAWISRSVYTSVLNAHLAFGAAALAKETILEMRADGINPDSINVAVLIRHELDRDPAAGFRLAEASAPDPQTGWPDNRPSGSLPHPAWVTILDYAVRDADPARTAWALANLHVDPDTGAGMDTVVFNILLRGVASREGCFGAMYMCHRFHTRGEIAGKRIGDATSFRTVLHSAIRELLRLKSEDDGNGTDEVRKQRRQKRKDVEDVITWCWEQLRDSGMEITDVIKTVRIWLDGEKSVKQEEVLYKPGDDKESVGPLGETLEKTKKRTRRKKDPSLRKHFRNTKKKKKKGK